MRTLGTDSRTSEPLLPQMCTMIVSLSNARTQLAVASSLPLALLSVFAALTCAYKVYRHVKKRRAQIMHGNVPTSVDEAAQVVMTVCVQVTGSVSLSLAC